MPKADQSQHEKVVWSTFHASSLSHGTINRFFNFLRRGEENTLQISLCCQRPYICLNLIKLYLYFGANLADLVDARQIPTWLHACPEKHTKL